MKPKWLSYLSSQWNSPSKGFSPANAKLDTFAYVLSDVSRSWKLHMTLKQFKKLLLQAGYLHVCMIILILDVRGF